MKSQPITIGWKMFLVIKNLCVGIKGWLLNWKCVKLNLFIPVQRPPPLIFLEFIIFEKSTFWNSSKLLGLHNDEFLKEITIRWKLACLNVEWYKLNGKTYTVWPCPQFAKISCCFESHGGIRMYDNVSLVST